MTDGTILSSFDSGEVRQFLHWLRIADTRLAPPGTRTVRIRLQSRRYDGTSNDGTFDAVSLRPLLNALTNSSRIALNGPRGVAIGPEGSLYVADTNHHRVVRFWPNGSASILAGVGEPGASGDQGPASAASLNLPTSVAIATDGSVYIADLGNHKIRRVAVDGTIGTVAGTGESGSSGNGGPAIDARLYDPISVAVAPDHSIYIAERSNHVIRRLVPDGTIETVAGTGFPGYNGDGLPATQTQLNRPSSVAVGSDGTLYIADDFNRRIRRVQGDRVRTESGTGLEGNTGDAGQAVSATFASLSGLAFGPCPFGNSA